MGIIKEVFHAEVYEHDSIKSLEDVHSKKQTKGELGLKHIWGQIYQGSHNCWWATLLHFSIKVRWFERITGFDLSRECRVIIFCISTYEHAGRICKLPQKSL